ncbi:nucleotidyltransferase domain-containing protein [Heyndrickxia acidiproducens]|uniref:nucleotidyltransferase domain-containing protein n=1 Tax=Heyndrickxia acidiproducens TaxID=1121084 RepID=UPI0003710F17|nr:nucleotidyltransferase domain-containing protein [Heyndrickxia acidiproducens]
MIDQRIKEQLVQIGLSTDKVKKIILFGSRAVGDDTDRSDIDLNQAPKEIFLFWCLSL